MQKSEINRSSVIPRVIAFGRWTAVLPAAWLVGYVHNWILRAFGVSISKYAVAAGDSDLLAFGVAGSLTPICVVAVGAFVCPARRKAMPVLALCALLIAAGASDLGRLITSGHLWHPPGVDALFFVSVSALIAITYTLVLWRSIRSQQTS